MEKRRAKVVIPKDDDETARMALGLGKRLQRMAQRGVIKSFSAVRAAQIKGNEGAGLWEPGTGRKKGITIMMCPSHKL